MKQWLRDVLTLSCAVAALAAGGFARAQEIPVLEVALVAGGPMQFHPLQAPSPPLGVGRVAEDR